MKEESEQKSQPASDKKLRDARRKGQVSHSRDLISGFGLLAVVMYFLFTWTTTRDHILQLVDLVSDSHGKPFAETWLLASAVAGEAIAYSIMPAIVILLLTSIVVGMVGTFGPVFSFELVKPNFEHINPVSGMKRIFSMRNIVEFLKGLVKVVAVSAALWLVLRSFLQPLLQMPACGEGCMVPVLMEAIKPIIAVAILAFIIIGIIDISLQRWLFLRDMRMTKTESKRERKDIEGDPQIRGERQRMRRMLATQSVRTGIKYAVVVIAHGDNIGGVRYHRQHTPIPTVVAKAKGEKAREMRAEAQRLGLTIVEDAQLAQALATRHRAGDVLNRDLFGPVAGILVKYNLV